MDLNEQHQQDIALLLQQNQKVKAIKLVMDTYKIGLKDAKDLVESFNDAQNDLAGSSLKTAKPKGVLDAEVLSLLHQGQKLMAIKKYKDATGCSLQQSKDDVEQLLLDTPKTAIKGNRDTDISQISHEISRTSNSGQSFLVRLIFILLMFIFLAYIISLLMK